MDNNFQALVDGYIALLNVDDKIRYTSNYQITLCSFRNRISELTKQSGQFIQEKYEEIALYEKRNLTKNSCDAFVKFCQNSPSIGFPPVFSGTAWDRYKYYDYYEKDNTYGQNINPEATKYLFESIQNLLGVVDTPVRRLKFPNDFLDESIKIAKAAIEKAKLI